MSEQCPACHSGDHRDFLSLPSMPVSIGVQWPNIDSARACARGDLQLTYCNSCGFIWNRSFDESRIEYSQRYDNSLDFSPVFQTYAEGLADRLIETYSISGKRVVELGCGKGHFLSLLCERGENSGIGFDPSYEGERVDSPVADRIEYVQDFYGEKYTDHPGDLVCCRHVLEHIQNPLAFLASVRKTVGGNADTIVYFEVPNVRLILERLSVWDIIYEHCNYFSHESIVNLFQRAGFEVLRIEETYEKQFLSIDCRLYSRETNSQATPKPIDDLSGLVDRFSAEMKERIGSWHKRLVEFEKDGKKVAIWGAGAKTVGFVNMLQIGDRIQIAIDINPHKQGLHLAGMGQKIVAPDQLNTEQPDVVIVMNPIYTEEIRSQLHSMGLSPEIIEA